MELDAKLVILYRVVEEIFTATVYIHQAFAKLERHSGGTISPLRMKEDIPAS